MDFSLNAEQELLRSSVRGLLESYCTKEWLDGVEAREEYPFELHKRMADQGIFGAECPRSTAARAAASSRWRSCPRRSAASAARWS